MENYQPEPTISQEIASNPFNDVYTKMDVVEQGGVRQLVSRILKLLEENKSVVLVAQGRQTSKAVTCAEIVKAKKTSIRLYQINRVSFLQTTETYDPLLEGLDPIRVTRSIPLIHILLSLDKIDEQVSGYQKTAGDGRKYSKKVIPSQFLT